MTKETAIKELTELSKKHKRLDRLYDRLYDKEQDIFNYALSLPNAEDIADVIKVMPSGMFRAELRAYYRTILADV